MKTDLLKKDMGLDELDRKILYHWDLNCRQPASQIAKLVGSNRNTVKFRMRRLVNSGVIDRFSTLVRFTHLGLCSIKVYLQFHDMNKNMEEKFYKYLESIEQIGTIVSCSGRWNAYFAIRTKSSYAGYNLIMDILSKYDKYILHKEIIHNIEIFRCNRKWLLEETPRPIVKKVCGELSRTQLDETDTEILKLLVKNGRIPVVEIAKKTGQLSQNIINRMRRLEKNEVITSYCLALDYSKIGFLLCKVFIYLQKATPDKLKELLSYCESQPNVYGIITTLGSWDLELVFEVESFEQMLSAMDDIRVRFNDLIKNYDPILLTKQSLLRLTEG
jgi:DNA-binding Lrp family transcriptional regulator